jgi:hypothetical protein
MVKIWGVLSQAFPLAWEGEGICANRKKSQRFGRSLRAFFLDCLRKQRRDC